MLELAIFQTGPTDLPSVAAEGIRVNLGTLAETHESFQRGLVDQIRQGILAEELGFNYCFPTEHHFQPEGVEFSPNPLFTGMAIAARTKRIPPGADGQHPLLAPPASGWRSRRPCWTSSAAAAWSSGSAAAISRARRRP